MTETNADVVIANRAATQHRVLTRQQLLADEVSRDQIKHRINSSLLVPVHRGVFKVGSAPLNDLGRWQAAVLALGDGAVLCLDSAAALWGIREERSSWVHVAIPPRARDGEARSGVSKRGGVWRHRPSWLRAEDVTEHRGIPVTTLLRTIFDLAPRLKPREFQRMMNTANVVHGLTSHAVLVALDSGLEVRTRNLRAMRRALQDHSGGDHRLRSLLEARLKAICADYGLPEPAINKRVGQFEADFHWPDYRLIVETDGGTHAFSWQREQDVARDEHHRAMGYEVVRVSYVQATYEPEQTARRIAIKLLERGWQPAVAWSMPA